MVLHLAFFCELYELQVRGGRYCLRTHPHSADRPNQPFIVGFMNRFPNTFHAVPDSSFFLNPRASVQGTRGVHGVKMLTRWLTNSGCIHLFCTPTHSHNLFQTITKAMSQSELRVALATGQSPHHSSLPKRGTLAGDADEETQVEWEAEDDVNGGPLNPHEAQIS